MSDRAWPPPPHDPSERDLVAACDDWLVLGFARSETKHAYFAPRGLLHLQLWHHAQRVSVLTPSALTAGRFEAFPIAGWKHATADYARLRGRILDEHHVLAPHPTVVRSLERWFVHRFERLAIAEQA